MQTVNREKDLSFEEGDDDSFIGAIRPGNAKIDDGENLRPLPVGMIDWIALFC